MLNLLLHAVRSTTAAATGPDPGRDLHAGAELSAYPLLRATLARAETNGLIAAERRRLSARVAG